MGRRGYPAEFRRRVLDLLASGRSVASVAADLGISDQRIDGWRQQERIDRGEADGLTSPEKAELAAARKKIAQLETQLAVATKAVEALKADADQKAVRGGRSDRRRRVAGAGRLPSPGCGRVRVLRATLPAPSERAVRHAWLTDLISQVHAGSHGRYGVRRVHAELTMARGIAVGHQQVELLMRRAGLQGLAGRRKWKRIIPDQIATDLVERNFTRAEPNQVRGTDITEHRTREGKVYCCVVLDTFSRRVVGWSIDSSPTAALATNALGMAIESRLGGQPAPGTVIHSDQGVQFGSWAFTTRAKQAGLLPSIGSIGDCYDNGMIEAFWSRMQVELLDTQTGDTRIELANAMFTYLEIWHNRQRRHGQLGWRTPIEYERNRIITVA